MRIFLASIFLLACLPTASTAQICAVDVTTQGVVVGINQTLAVRTANTKSLNGMFADIGSGRIHCHHVAFPEGTIEIAGSVLVTTGPITISGVNRELSVIMQTSPNDSVFVWNSNNKIATSISVHDIGFDNSNEKPPFHPEQWGLRFQCTPDGSGGNGWGYASNQFQRINVSHMNVGIGTYTTSGGICPVWSTHFEDIKFYNMQEHAVSLVSSGDSGQPANQLDRIDVLQQNDAPVTTGDAIFVVAGNGLLMNSIDIEGWYNSEMQIYGGAGTVINNLRVEHAVFTGCNPAIAFLDGDVTLNGTVISWDRFNFTCQANVFSMGGSLSNLVVNGVTLASTVGPPDRPLTMWRVDKPDPPGKIFANSLNLNGIATEYLPSTGNLSTTLYSRYTIDGMPAMVDTLPAPGAVYLGRSFTVVKETGNSVYRCVLNRFGKYEWVDR